MCKFNTFLAKLRSILKVGYKSIMYKRYVYFVLYMYVKTYLAFVFQL
jgi:hypothetical protein